MEVSVGDRVAVNGMEAVVAFYGQTSFQEGIWVGVELPSPVGKNDGSVFDVKYFGASHRCVS